MMKQTTLSMLIVLAAAAAVSHSSVINPSPSQPELTSLALDYGSKDLPKGPYAVEVSEGLDNVEGEAGHYLGGSSLPKLLFKGQYIRFPIWNAVRVHIQTWRGYSAITSVYVLQVGPNQNATAKIIDGGKGHSHVP